MCDYMGYEFGAGRYPDSVCIEGRLFDADSCDGEGNLYDTGDDIPCPICRPADSIEYWTEQNSGFVVEGMTDEEADAKAHADAISLVNDIRNNRGEEPYIVNSVLEGKS